MEKRLELKLCLLDMAGRESVCSGFFGVFAAVGGGMDLECE